MKKIVLAILDGFGLRDEQNGNAIKGNTPNIDKLNKEYPHTTLVASGEEVGLPAGQMGNSEVGHLNIGAGRIVYQPLELISKSIRDGSFFERENLKEVLNHAKKNDSKLHIFGLLSDGGIHSHISHIFALLEACQKAGLKKVYVHAFLDGRDTLPKKALEYLKALEDKMQQLNCGSLADISGRYYSMDRERMWDLTKTYYDLLVFKSGTVIKDYESYIKKSYEEGLTDEFIKPVIIDENGSLEENDALIFANFRPDRATQTFTAITNNEFKEFPTKHFKNIFLATMMPVEKTIICKNIFSHILVENPLGVYLANLNKKVLRIAEASKYPHVTYFFDGGKELELPNTDKIIVPRKDVETYDLAPRMSADEITEKLIEIVENYDLVILNYANCDMVGHTGNFKKTIEAVACVDENVLKLYNKIKEIDGLLIITADHGNAELMIDENSNVITSHTTNPVPFIICSNAYHLKDGGKLADIAPTILDIMHLEKPVEMTGESLLK